MYLLLGLLILVALGIAAPYIEKAAQKKQARNAQARRDRRPASKRSPSAKEYFDGDNLDREIDEAYAAELTSGPAAAVAAPGAAYTPPLAGRVTPEEFLTQLRAVVKDHTGSEDIDAPLDVQYMSDDMFNVFAVQIALDKHYDVELEVPEEQAYDLASYRELVEWYVGAG